MYFIYLQNFSTTKNFIAPHHTTLFASLFQLAASIFAVSPAYILEMSVVHKITIHTYLLFYSQDLAAYCTVFERSQQVIISLCAFTFCVTHKQLHKMFLLCMNLKKITTVMTFQNVLYLVDVMQPCMGTTAIIGSSTLYDPV